MREPLLLPLTGFVAGILLAGGLDFSPPEPAVCAAVLLALALLAARRRLTLVRGVCLWLALAAAGAWTATARRPAPSPVPIVNGEIQPLQGCVVAPLAGPPDRPYFVLEVAPKARVRVSVYPRPGEPAPAPRYGQRVALEARVREPRTFRNPGSFDYAAWLAARDIHWQASLAPKTSIRTLDGACGSGWRAVIFHLRGEALARLDSLYAGDGYDRGMMKGLLIGDSSEIRRVWIEDFRRTGTYHALVISGSHVSFLAGLFLFWRRWSRWGESGVLALACGVAWLYALVAGADAPVLRSAAGFTLAVAAWFFYRRTRLLNVVAAVAILFLALDPSQLYEASFQLSFLAVAAIAALAVPLLESTSGVLRGALRAFPTNSHPTPLKDARAARLRVELLLLAETIHLSTRLPERVCRRALAWTLSIFAFAWEMALLSAAVQLALVLPMVAYFHRLSLSGLTANVAATPVITAAIPFGFLAILTGWLWPAQAAAALLDLSRHIVAWHAAWEPRWRVPDPPLALALIFGLTLVAACIALRHRRRWGWLTATACAASLAAIALHPFPPRAAPGTLELSAIDVGQGESLFLALPDGQGVLMDTGGLPTMGRKEPPRLDTGEDVVSPYLWTRGYRRLAVLALSHLHLDHAGGARAVLENFRPRELWVGTVPDTRLWRELEAAATRQGTHIRYWHAGQRLSLGGVEFEALAPFEGNIVRPKQANDDSLVLRVRHQRHTFLLTGDLERRMERRLVEAGQPGRVDVLKIAHHGSRRSSHPDFLDAARPALALISVGLDNQFRLPNDEVIEALQARGAMVLRTDEEGLVTIRSDGARFHIETMRRRPSRFARRDPF